ncbi:flavin-containing monooxygenase [Aurantiacibacter flavus]|uniref:NAD(P)/FAD-dependent oxidoreductase n=1 Tax=Aurantiacibacter flavus TaxID=3145232 RepID=A0ABV0CY10_9SPHN
MTEPDFDVLIVGAGISGISMAAHLGMICPEASYAVFERRQAIGGTWDLFRYPGVRSDSDMHTLGFSFAPWRDENAIADGPAILAYLEQVAEERGIIGNIYFDREVLSADWDAAKALWRVTARLSDGRTQIVTCRWLYFASGYYDYDTPHDAELPGLGAFGGAVVHPQFWPDDLDYAGKRVVVIGSGATAVTIVPAMAETAAHVTMLQRTPTWMTAAPRQDQFGMLLQRILPERWASWLIRQKNIALNAYFFGLSRRNPARAASMLRKMLKQQLGPAYDPKHFEPPYTPWQQRLCLVPDGDLFAAVKSGKAKLVTDTVAGFDEGGVRLTSGAYLPADIVVTATGLRLVLAGKAAVSMGGQPVDFTQRYFYRGTMFSNVPNLSVVFGYLNASWTLRADNNARFAAEAVAHMRRTGTSVATPELLPEDEPEPVAPFDYTSGYLQRARSQMPKSAAELPWRLNHDYYEDARDFRSRPVADGILRFTSPAPTEEPAQ